ncbi:hypothetical protein GCM10020254_87630 [Streptomyces goshikiensis]
MKVTFEADVDSAWLTRSADGRQHLTVLVTTDVANAAAPPSELRPWCGPCWKQALEHERARVADQNRRELEAGQLGLFDLDRGAAA